LKVNFLFLKKAIFEKCGSLKRCGIHWDKLGNSLGTADIEYYNSRDAEKAINDYDSIYFL